jgi:hypothetical protein
MSYTGRERSSRRRSIAALAIIMAALLSSGCGPHIGDYSKEEIADEIAREYGVERAEKWLTEEYDAEAARRWREKYDKRTK